MKKFAMALVAFISTILMCFGVAACDINLGGILDKDPSSGSNSGSSVAGKIYVFEDATIKFDSSVSDEEKAEMNEQLEYLKSMYSDSQMTFKKDGTCLISTGAGLSTQFYTQNENVVRLYFDKSDLNADEYTTEFTVNRGKLESKMEEDGFTVTVIYVYSKDYSDGSSGNNDKDNSSDPYSVAGKVYRYSDLSVKFDDSVSKEDREIINNSLEFVKGMYEGTKVAFLKDGTCLILMEGRISTQYYVQKEHNVYLFNSANDYKENENAVVVEVKKDEIVITSGDEGYSFLISYKYDGLYNSDTFGKGDGNHGNNDNDKDPGNSDKDPAKPGTTTSEVAGKVYVFYNVDIKIETDLPFDKSEIEKLESKYKDSQVAFNKDGTCVVTMGGEKETFYYRQNGNDVYLFDSRSEAEKGDITQAVAVKVNGSNIEICNSMPGFTVVVMYKYGGTIADNPGNSGNSGNNDNPGNSGQENRPGTAIVDVAGKVYRFVGLEVSYDENLPYDDVFGEVDIDRVEKMYDGSEIAFNNDETYVTVMSGYVEKGYYVQNGNVVYIFTDKQDYLHGNLSEAVKLFVEENSVKLVNSMDGITVALVFKYNRENGGLDIPDDPDHGYDKPDKPDDPGHDWDKDDVSSITGRSYLYEYSEFELGPDAGEEDIEDMNEWYKDVEIVFKEDGLCLMIWWGQGTERMYYVQEGNEVYLYENSIVAGKGDKSEAMLFTMYGKKLVIVWEEIEKDIKMTSVFRLNESGNSGNSGSGGGWDVDHPSDDEPAYDKDISVAGKFFEYYDYKVLNEEELGDNDPPMLGMYMNTTFAFYEDGTFVQNTQGYTASLYYVQEGEVIYVFLSLEDYKENNRENTITLTFVEGRIYLTETQFGIVITTIYKCGGLI